MDDELKSFLIAMETRSTEQMRRLNAELKAELKADLGELKAELKAELKVEMKAQIEIFRQEMDEKLQDLETKLLSEFWKWGRNADQRIRRVELSDGTTTERMASLEDRVFTLERKVAGSKS